MACVRFTAFAATRDATKIAAALEFPGGGRIWIWLHDDRFAVRGAATEALGALGVLAESALRRARSDLSVETSHRADGLPVQLSGSMRSPEVPRSLCGVEVLERIGNAAARRLLLKLGEGTTDAPLTQEAKEALVRLGKGAGAEAP
jgi:hypothetical protein